MPSLSEDAFELYSKLLLEGFAPDHMVVADPRILDEAGLEPGTWLFQKGKEPIRLGELEQFEQIGYGMLGVTQTSLNRLADE